MTAPSRDASPDAPPLLEARDIWKAFPGVQALAAAGITVRPGRLTALLGENGAGKSTLMNILAGVFPPDSGTLALDGQPVSFRSPREAQDAGVSIIFQELNLVDGLSVAENIFLGRQPQNAWGLVDHARMRRDAAAILAALDIDIEPSLPVERLKVGARQMVEIAKALSFASRVLILDEPTSALTQHEAETLFRVIAKLKAQGVGMVYITHRLDELARIADDVTIFRDGRLVHEAPFNAADRGDYVRRMVGRDLADGHRRVGVPPGSLLLEVERFSVARPGAAAPLVADVSLAVRAGEVVGLFGLMGAGRTELLEALAGLHPGRTTGTLRVDGAVAAIRSPREALAAGIVLAPEDRKADGLVLDASVAKNVSLASLDTLTRFGFVSRRREDSRGRDAVARLGIKTPSIAQAVGALSGGNQQKVVLAKGLACGPRVLLLDEPTRGIDVGAKREIYALIDDLSRQGLAVLVASSELPEVLAISDRILVLAEGRMTAEFTRAEATEQAVLHAAIPRARRTGAVA
ncbi:MAG: sugar ABC transporter ATP-binding protein [Pirellulales bacterium]